MSPDTSGSMNFWILGDVFHRKYYVSYDWQNKQVLLPKKAYKSRSMWYYIGQILWFGVL